MLNDYGGKGANLGLCGSYIHAFIFIIISGMFGASVIFTSFFFAYEYFVSYRFSELYQTAPITYLAISNLNHFKADAEKKYEDFPFIKIGPSFLCVISGTAIIWLFSLIDLILLGRIFNQAKKAVGTVENPYSD